MFQIWSLRIALRKFMNLGMMLTHCSHAALFMHCNFAILQLFEYGTLLQKGITREGMEKPLSIKEHFSCNPQSFYPMPEKSLRHEVAA
jgi:hypothetical protein